MRRQSPAPYPSGNLKRRHARLHHSPGFKWNVGAERRKWSDRNHGKSWKNSWEIAHRVSGACFSEKWAWHCQVVVSAHRCSTSGSLQNLPKPTCFVTLKCCRVCRAVRLLELITTLRFDGSWKR